MIRLRDILLEGLEDAWEDGNQRVTLRQLLTVMEDIPVQIISVSKLEPYLLHKNDSHELEKSESSDLSYPILIIINDDGSIRQIIDGHHRIQKSIRHKLPTIKYKMIKFNDLPADFKTVLK